MRFLTKYAGMRRREIARLPGMGSGATASARHRCYEGWLEADPKLRKRIGKVDGVLDGRKAKGEHAK